MQCKYIHYRQQVKSNFFHLTGRVANLLIIHVLLSGTQWIVNENLPLFKLKGCSSLSNEKKCTIVTANCNKMQHSISMIIYRIHAYICILTEWMSDASASPQPNCAGH